MRGDVLKIIASAKNVANAIVLTHNIDFVFVQTVALSAFRRCGQPTITIFADAGCAAESFAHQAPVLDGLGVRYRVVPVAMEPGFRFHPKAVLLSGEATATLLVGSGNLTFGGWRENAEVWVRFDSETDGVAPFAAFRTYLTEILRRVPLPDAVVSEVEEAFDPKSKSWATVEPVGTSALLGRVGSGSALLDRMLERVGAERIDEFVACAPYFDEDGEALLQLSTRVNADRTVVLCQPERSTLTKRAWEPSTERAVLHGADFKRTNDAGEERSVFMHAKFYAFRRADEVIVLAGSANCSRAALTVRGAAGNAELLAAQRLTAHEFKEAYINELVVSSKAVLLRDDPPVGPDSGALPGPALRVLAARYEAGSLLIGYAPPSVAMVECSVDDLPMQFSSVEAGILRASCATEPKVVVIRGRIDGELIESGPAWVDHERHLRSTARGRNLADSIRARLQPGEWSASAWAELLDVFCKHLSYMPAHRLRGSASRGSGDREPAEELQFTAADAFSPDYRTPSLAKVRIPAELGGRGHLHSLQHLLLRWFGVAADETDLGRTSNAGESPDTEGDDDDVVDRPESLTVPPSLTPAAEATERDRRRIELLLKQLEAAMTSPDFLAERGPEHLATDLKVAAALLRVGLREGWVDRERFFEVTQRIWSSLFFAWAPQREVGWLEHRARSADDSEAFIDAMRSPELSAALVGWELAVPRRVGTPEAARFALVAALAVARLPWLWHSGDQNEIAEELAALLSYTADPGQGHDELVARAEAEWDLLLRRGHALRRLEAAVANLSPAEIRERVRIGELHPGDLLWQGSAGFCVVLKQCPRVAGLRVPVLRLQAEGGEALFVASYTVPVRALLDDDTVPRTDGFGEKPRRVLRDFLAELASGFGP